MIRQLKPDEARREALRAWRRLADLSGDRAGEVLGRRGYSLAMIVTGRPDSKPGRRGRSDLFYAEIGDAHAAMIERGSRKPNVELAELLASSWEKPVAAEQVRDWLHAARSRRIVRRKPGPTWGLTEKGERVLNETKGSEK